MACQLFKRMKPTEKLKSIVPEVWMMSFPLMTLGVDLQRNVTILRLASKKLIVHSTAPFSADDVASIRQLGEPGWIVEGLLRHDTFATQGTKAFPGVPYLATERAELDGVGAESVFPPPAEWGDEVAVLPVNGVPSFGEIAMLHRPTRTLIAGDLLFNFPGKQDLVKKVFLNLGAVVGKYDPGVTRPFKRAIEDEMAFVESVRAILEWDFDRIIVAHGEPIRSGGKEKLRTTLKHAGIGGL